MTRIANEIKKSTAIKSANALIGFISKEALLIKLKCNEANIIN